MGLFIISYFALLLVSVSEAILIRFWTDFGRILTGFAQTQILDFRFFSHHFSMQILECNLEDKNGKKTPTRGLGYVFRRSVRPWGEGKRMGGMSSCRPKLHEFLA